MAVRNYINEAKAMIKGLIATQKYELYEIVNEQLKRQISDDRAKELRAVQSALEQDRELDKSRLKRILNGEVGMTSEISDYHLTSNKKIFRKKN